MPIKNVLEAHLMRRSMLRGMLAGGAAVMTSNAVAAPRGVIVQTRQGRLRGLRSGAISEFRGVRYAEPQTAANRFMAPIPLKPWAGIRDAIKNGNTAPQAAGSKDMNPWQAPFQDPNPKSEDCLFLNVFTPAVDHSKKRPVMFWIHGGAWARGSGSMPAYDAHNLAAFGDVVVVTVNHRLNALGYLYLAEIGGPEFANSGNAGMLDLIEALKWVRDNITAFGGDPENVTIFGQSGGGAKVSVLLGMPAAAGLYHKAIVQSGPNLSQQTAQSATEVARNLMQRVGAKSVAELRSIPLDQLVAAGDHASPVVDGTNLPRNAFDPDATPLVRSIPLMIGGTQSETRSLRGFVRFDIQDGDLIEAIRPLAGERSADLVNGYKANHPDLSAVDLYTRITTDLIFRGPAVLEAERKVRLAGAPTFMYHITWKPPVYEEKWASPHALDLPLIFRNHKQPLMMAALGTGPVQDRMAEAMSSAWVAFAKTGNPSNSVTGTWLPYDLETRKTMVFGQQLELVNDPDSADRQLFGSIPEARLLRGG